MPSIIYLNICLLIYTIYLKCICMYIWVNIYLNLVPRAFCLHGGGFILGTRLHLPYIRLFHLTSAHPLSRIHVLEEYPWRIPASKPEPLRNSSLKNLNFWGSPARKTWNPEEFQHKKREPLRNSSLTNINHWIIPASKISTPEEFQYDYFGTPKEFQFYYVGTYTWFLVKH